MCHTCEYFTEINFNFDINYVSYTKYKFVSKNIIKPRLVIIQFNTIFAYGQIEQQIQDTHVYIFN